MSEKVCIIGAGASGLAAAKIFRERGIPYDAFEIGSDIGGLWRFENDSGLSPAYRSLRTNTSRHKTGYADFPMPSTYPDYPSHEEVLAYLEAYADRFGLKENTSFRTRVEHVHPVEGSGYQVSFRSLDDDVLHVRTYKAVVAASGHHWKPYRPEVPGQFSGHVMHSMEYRVPDDLSGRRVLVVGIGNSACDIVCEVCRVAERTYLSTRRGAHVIPKYLLGRPLDHWLSPLAARLPLALRRALFSTLIFLQRGPQTWYGLRVPDHRLGEEHPTISTDLLRLVKNGSIQPKPGLEAFDGDRVKFVDGSDAEVDVVIYATGYLISFPYLDFIEVRDNDIALYHHVVHPRYDGLYFLGLVQPLGALPPLAEAQSEWVADLIEGRCILPSRAEMEAAIRRDQGARRQRYVDSRRHRVEVEVYPYLSTITAARKLRPPSAAEV